MTKKKTRKEDILNELNLKWEMVIKKKFFSGEKQVEYLLTMTPEYLEMLKSLEIIALNKGEMNKYYSYDMDVYFIYKDRPIPYFFLMYFVPGKKGKYAELYEIDYKPYLPVPYKNRDLIEMEEVFLDLDLNGIAEEISQME